MSSLPWSLTEWTARTLLPERYRDAVLGDLFETQTPLHRALPEILWLSLRQSNREWISTFAWALPCALLADGLAHVLWRANGVNFVFWNAALFGAALWMGLANRLLLCSAMLCLPPCLWCLAYLDLEGITQLSLCIALPIAVWSLIARRTPQVPNLRRLPGIVIAVALTLLTIPLWHSHQAPSHEAWLPAWMLSWPAWYLIAANARQRRPA